MPYWKLFLILQTGMCAVLAWALVGKMYFSQRPLYSLSHIQWNASRMLDSAFTISFFSLWSIAPLTLILYLLSDRIGVFPWL